MRTEGLHPRCAVGQLIQRGDAAVIGETNEMDVGGVKLVTGRPPFATVMARNEQPAVVEGAELFGLCLGPVVAGDPPPQIALHVLRSDVLAAHVQWESFGGVPDEVWMQQLPQRVAIAGGERTI